MKTLGNFTMNADASGVQTFTQVRRDGNVCLYRRNRTNEQKTLFNFEIFLIKTVLAGSPLPGGGHVAEDYEPYPGKSAFGRTAWNTNNERRANQIFDGLLAKRIVEVEGEPDETELVTVARVSAPKGDRRKINFPTGPFTQKELAAFNGIANYKEVYTDLQRALADGTLKVSNQVKETTRGRAAKMFEVVTKAAAIVLAAIVTV